MREVKYRGWLKPTKEMFAVHAMSPTAVEERKNGMGFQYDRREVVLMQYTGLKDKNGVEVYEGDIYKSIHEKVFGIVWDIETAGFIGVSNGHTPAILYKPLSGEIIGNIYENPELLGVSPD